MATTIPAGPDGSIRVELAATGVVAATVPVAIVDNPAALAAGCDLVVVAVPANGHRAVIDALLPGLRDGQMVFVSAMSSLSALYLAECARAAGRDITVMASGTTVLTARRRGPAAVDVLTRRGRLGLSVWPVSRQDAARARFAELFGEVTFAEPNLLASVLANTNPVAHVPLAVLNWTRIERAEVWPQYHYMTPRVSAVIDALDAERLALAKDFGLSVRSIAEHLAASFGVGPGSLAEIAAELHARRGGPPGPTDLASRYLTEDVPFGLVFQSALGRVAGRAMPATEAMIATAGLASGCDFTAANDLLGPLGIASATREGLLARVTAR